MILITVVAIPSPAPAFKCTAEVLFGNRMEPSELGMLRNYYLVPMAGLEPARLAPLTPQASVSTSSTTSARQNPEHRADFPLLLRQLWYVRGATAALRQFDRFFQLHPLYDALGRGSLRRQIRQGQAGQEERGRQNGGRPTEERSRAS